MFFTREVWCIADVLSVGPFVGADCERSKHKLHTKPHMQAKNMGRRGGGVVLSYSLDGGVPLGSRKSYPLPD